MECPKCKEEIVVGNVCPVCGHVIEDGAQGQSSRELTDSMEALLNGMKSVPEISLGTVFSGYLTWLLPLVAIGFGVMALASEAGLFWILFGITAVAAVWKLAVSMGKGRKGTSADFNALKNDMETMIRLARRDYGHSSEMKRLVQDVENEVFSIAKSREAALRRNRVISIVIAVLVVLLVIFGAAGVFAIVK